MKTIYYVKIGEQKDYGNIFVFTAYKTAYDFCKAKTAWDEYFIKQNIKKATTTDTEPYFVLYY